MTASNSSIANRRGSVGAPSIGAQRGRRRRAARGALDARAGLALWLTLVHGVTGAGIGFAIGSLVL